METKQVISLSDQCRKDLDRKHERLLAELPLEYACIDFLQDYISQLPSEDTQTSELGSFWTTHHVWTNDGFGSKPKVYFYIHYYPSNEEIAEQLRSSTQLIIKIPAQRKLNTRTGDTQYVFARVWKEPFSDGREVAYELNIDIDKGSLAKGCTLVQVEKTVKEWEPQCPEGQEED